MGRDVDIDVCSFIRTCVEPGQLFFFPKLRTHVLWMTKKSIPPSRVQHGLAGYAIYGGIIFLLLSDHVVHPRIIKTSMQF